MALYFDCWFLLSLSRDGWVRSKWCPFVDIYPKVHHALKWSTRRVCISPFRRSSGSYAQYRAAWWLVFLAICSCVFLHGKPHLMVSSFSREKYQLFLLSLTWTSSSYISSSLKLSSDRIDILFFLARTYSWNTVQGLTSICPYRLGRVLKIRAAYFDPTNTKKKKNKGSANDLILLSKTVHKRFKSIRAVASLSKCDSPYTCWSFSASLRQPLPRA